MGEPACAVCNEVLNLLSQVGAAPSRNRTGMVGGSRLYSLARDVSIITNTADSLQREASTDPNAPTRHCRRGVTFI